MSWIKLFLTLVVLVLGLAGASFQGDVWLYGGGTFGPDDEISLEYSMNSGQDAKLLLYRIRDPEQILKMGGPRYFDGSNDLDLKKIREIKIGNNKDQYWGDISLGKLKVGMYFAQLESKESKSATLILVTDISLVVKTDTKKILTYTANKYNGKPLDATVYMVHGTSIEKHVLADKGTAELAVIEDNDNETVIAANYGDSWAFSSSYWRSWAVEKSKTYIQTDRPVYRPGHTVFFKATARSASGLKPLANQEITITIRDANYDDIYKESFKTDDYGSVNGELLLSVEPPLGNYEITTEIDGEYSYSVFYVEEFQKPEYKVNVSSSKDKLIQGETVEFEVSAEYLFGGSVTGGKVNYAVLKQPYYYWSYRSYYGFYDSYFYDSYYDSEVVERGEAVLDENGKLVLEFETSKDDVDYKYTLQAGVVDEARREISASASTTVFRSNIVINVRADRYAYKENDKVTLYVTTKDIYGEPVSTDFSVNTERYYWDYDNGRETDKQITKYGRTDKNGEASVSFVPSKQGSYNIFVTAKDSNGRKVESSEYIWVSGNSRWYWAYDSLNIKADKEEYKLGETARFVIQSPVADAYALVSREGQEIAEYELIKINGSVLTYELTVTADMSPNSYISVVIIGDGRTYSETVGFKVPPDNKFLNVEINSDSDTYEPGQEGHFQLRVSDVDGNGVRAQVTVGIVDEGIYLIRSETNADIRGFYYAMRSNIVSTDISDWYYFGRAEVLETSAGLGRATMADSPLAPIAEKAVAMAMVNGEGAFGQAKGDFAPANIRSDFRDTILWLPTQETNDEGIADVTVTFPDNLTEWRLTARAISLDDKVGQDNYSVKTTLPVIARLAAPRFFIRGDEASLRVIAQNNLDEDLIARIKLEAVGLIIQDPLQSAAIIAAKNRATANFRIKASETGTALVTATVLTDQASDAMQLPIPVLAHGIKDNIAWASSNSDFWSFSLPINTDPNTVNGKLFISPSLAAAVSPALSYLAGYPYGCTEQTMSRFYPSVLASQAGDLAMLPEDVLENLDDMVAKGLKRIYNFQHDDGGWGYWKHDSSSLFITSYVINGLVDADKAGYRTQEYSLNWAVEYLERELENPLSNDDFYRIVDADSRAYGYYALARAQRNIDGLGKYVASKDMSSYGLSLSVLAFAEANRTVEANLYLDELLSRVSEFDTIAFWKSDVPRYYWNDDQIEATAYGLNAIAKLRPNDPIVAKIVNWLLLERKGDRWRSTKDTAAIVKAALDLAKATNEEAKDLLITASLNGQEIYSSHLTGQSAEGIEIELPNLDLNKNKLVLNVEGQGTVYSSANVDYFAEQDSFEAHGESLQIKRTFERLEPVYDKKNQNYIYKRKPLDSASEVGDYILVTVEIDPQDQFRYAIVNEPLPAGFRVIENDQVFKISGMSPRYGYDYYGWNYWYDGRDVRDERVDYYFTYLGDKVSFTYILRAETPGKYSALPTQAWLMYAPEIRSSGTDQILEIK